LEAYSHVLVLYWFDKNDTPEKRGILRVHPRGNKNNPLTGVFACRAPVRPNLIGLTLCRIQSVAEGTIRIDKIDALNGSPIVDIKPYVPTIDSTTENVQTPQWLSS
jgi:tRNA (adenine37-N6)-methyltransferase